MRTVRSMKRGALCVGLATGLVITELSAGAAFAYFKITGGSGTGTAATAASAQTVTASAASLSGALFPGNSVNLIVTVANPYSNLALTVTGLVAGTGSISVSGGSGCTVANSGVTLNTGATFSPSTVPAGSSGTQITFTNAVQMSTASNTGCQGATFTVPAAVTVKAG